MKLLIFHGIVVAIILFSIVHYVFCIETKYANVSYVVAVSTLAICLKMLMNGESFERFENFSALNLETMKKVTLIPIDIMNVINPQLDFVIKSISSVDVQEEGAKTGGKLDVNDAFIAKEFPELSKPDVTKTTMEFKNINMVLTTLSNVYPEVYKKLQQVAS